jgi:hypothetical protein
MVHHQTKRAADMSLAKKQISPDSHRAVIAGDLFLDEARELGRDAGPGGPVVRVNKADRSRECLCSCGNRTKGGRFVPGHDMRLVTYAKEYVRGERELTPEQMEYVEQSGKLERVREQVAKEQAKEQARVQKKAKEE